MKCAGAWTRWIELLACFFVIVDCRNWLQTVNLPAEHLAIFFNLNPDIAAECAADKYCPYKIHLNRIACWGYEGNCSRDYRYSYPVCLGDAQGWVKRKEDQIETFLRQGDFGYVAERLQEMKTICEPINKGDSSLECAKYMRFCRAKNLMMDFSSLVGIEEPMRYRMDVIREGQVGGHCTFHSETLHKEGYHKSPLQSWYPELEHFTVLPKNIDSTGTCDLIIDKPTFIMKLDATVNMYHHFCDFLNLYASFHLNNTFSMDIYILIWDTMAYRSNFGVMWKAFTMHPVFDLQSLKGKKVCFRNVVFPLLPRMIFGMYYNMPLVSGCEGSGLFHAFSKHVLYRLNVQQENKDMGKVRITLLSRGTQYRKILNEDKLIDAMNTDTRLSVRKVNFHWHMPFIEQLQISHNTDILIGIHGAGLTHMLFLPDWAAVFEIYNCDDEACYRDLAHLRGVRYFTWENLDKLFPEDQGNHPTMGAHAKFTNYEFDLLEFLRIINLAIDHVTSHTLWQDQRASRSTIRDEF